MAQGEGLFSLAGMETPEQVRQRIGKAEELQGMQQDISWSGGPEAAILRAAAQGGRMLGGGLGGFIAPPPEHPEIALAKQRQQMMQGLDMNDPNALFNASKSAFDSGDTQAGVAFADRANALKVQQGKMEYQDAQTQKLIDDAKKTRAIPEGLTGNAALAYIVGNPDKFTPGMVSAADASLKKTAGTTVRVDMTGKKQETKSLAEKRAERAAGEIWDRSLAAESALHNIDTALVALESTDTGMFEPAKLSVSRFLEGIGMGDAVVKFGLQDATSPSMFNMAMKRLVLGEAQKLKGALSDRDLRFLEDSLSSLSGDKEANILMLKSLKQMALRERERADFYAKFEEDNGTLTPKGKPNVDRAWLEYASEHNTVGRKRNGEPVFYYEFVNAVKQQNPEASQSDIDASWRKLYAVK